MQIVNEEWKVIPGFDGKYQVSNLGKAKSVKCNELRLINNGKGYLSISLCKNGKAKHCYIHRLIAFAFLDNPNNYTEINHKDGNKANNHYSNLEWCSRSHNLKHAFKLGLKIPTDVHGAKNPRYKHGRLILVNTSKNCIICGKDFIARLAHITHCSASCTTTDNNKKRAALKEQAKLSSYAT